MDARELEIQKLCQQVVHRYFHWDMCSPSSMSDYDKYICNFCGATVPDNKEPEEMVHSEDCAYLIAKDLSTGIKI